MSRENVELIRRLYGRWERGDFATPGFFDPGVEYARIGAEGVGASGVWRGVEEMWGSFVDWLRDWEELQMTAGRYVDVDKSRVLVLAKITARGRRSGVAVDYDVGHVFTIRGRKITRWDDYRDPADALNAVASDD